MTFSLSGIRALWPGSLGRAPKASGDPANAPDDGRRRGVARRGPKASAPDDASTPAPEAGSARR
ncbi:MAG: hypothetical protein KKI08_17795, partial [Armatimonadetes bacterium]|nr:hypothetical protein [Armatimonadota bacterium]